MVVVKFKEITFMDCVKCLGMLSMSLHFTNHAKTWLGPTFFAILKRVYREGETPDPIPNSVVKPFIGESSARETWCQDSTMRFFFKNLGFGRGFFLPAFQLPRPFDRGANEMDSPLL